MYCTPEKVIAPKIKSCMMRIVQGRGLMVCGIVNIYHILLSISIIYYIYISRYIFCYVFILYKIIHI